MRPTAPARPRPPEQQALTVAGVPVTPIGMVIGAAALRGLAVAVSGLLALAGLAILIWAFTPASGSEATEALRAGVAAFAAANLMPVSVAGIPLTLSPLLFSAMLVALLAITAQRGRFQPEGRYQETLAILTTAVVYGLVVAATVRGFGPADAIPASSVWTAPLLALVAVVVGTLIRPSGWRNWWLLVTPAWLRRAVRAGGVAAAAMVGGGAVVLCAGLLLHFGSAVGISAVAAPTWADGLGLAVVGVAYVPNAVIAAVGYASGVGFEVGPATFSPLGSTPTEMPALPLLAAAPENAGPTALSLTVFLVPVLAGLLAGRVLVRRTGRARAAHGGRGRRVPAGRCGRRAARARRLGRRRRRAVVLLRSTAAAARRDRHGGGPGCRPVRRDAQRNPPPAGRRGAGADELDTAGEPEPAGALADELLDDPGAQGTEPVETAPAGPARDDSAPDDSAPDDSGRDDTGPTGADPDAASVDATPVDADGAAPDEHAAIDLPAPALPAAADATAADPTAETGHELDDQQVGRQSR